MDDDSTLLKQYRAGSQAAFAQLVARHVDWVHAGARRRLGNDAARADDVTQAVFVALATRGPTDRSEGAMAAWMFRVLRHAAANVVRSEARRRKHEANAARREVATPDASWDEIAPRLDALVDQLSARDREAILLRFYRKQTNEAVGAALGIGEEGARKRIARALDKLRVAFAKAGVSMPAVAMGESLTTHVAPAAPAGLTIAATPTATIASLAASATARPVAAYALAGVALVCIAAAAIVARPDARRFAATRDPLAATTVESDESTTRPTTLTLAELLVGVKRNESALRAIEVRFTSTTSRRAPGETAWTPTPLDMEGTATYSADGRARIDFDHCVTEWLNGAAPTIDTGGLYTWNGVEGRSLDRVIRHSGKTMPYPFAQVTRERPPYIAASPWIACQTGVGYTLQFLADSSGKWPSETGGWLSARIERSAAAGVPPTLAMQRLHGMETVRIQWDGPSGSLTYWLAVDRGLALVRRQTPGTPPRQQEVETMDVLELREVRPGAWFPWRATMTMPELGRGRQPNEVRYEYATTGTTVFDDPRPAAVFTIAWPAGTRLTDARGKERREFAIHGDGEEPTTQQTP